jgi:hypothetical protein
VFYTSLGHHADIVDSQPVRTIIERGFLWASDGKDTAIAQGKEDLSVEELKKAF